MDIGIISKQLGHASLSTTAHYLDQIAPWAVVDSIAGLATEEIWKAATESLN